MLTLCLPLQSKTAAVDELFGNTELCFSRYQSAQILLHSLCSRDYKDADRQQIYTSTYLRVRLAAERACANPFRYFRRQSHDRTPSEAAAGPGTHLFGQLGGLVEVVADDPHDNGEHHSLSTRTQSSKPPTLVHSVRAHDNTITIIITLLYISPFNRNMNTHNHMINIGTRT